MIWVAWRQQRVAILFSLALIAAFMAVAVYMRIDANSILVDANGNPCRYFECDPFVNSAFGDKYRRFFSILVLLLLMAPLVVGALTGAPLFAREAEKGTHVFALTQSVSRRRWWATKLAVAAVPLVAAMLVLGLVNSWAFEPFYDFQGGPLVRRGFESNGLVMAAYTGFVFSLATGLGIVAKRVVPTLAAVGVLYLVALTTIGYMLRPHYMEPEQFDITFNVGELAIGSLPDNSWLVGGTYFDEQGNDVTDEVAECADDRCMTATGAVARVSYYQPIERFWSFQAVESGVYLLLSAVALTGGAWALRTRYTTR